MSHEMALAEVKFPQYAVNLYGRVEQMNQNSVRIRLETEPEGAHVLRVGNEAQLMVVARGAIYRAAVQVSEAVAQRVTMKFSSPPHTVQRRHAHRRDCNFNVFVRAIQSGGCEGAWQEGRAADVSSGGMQIVVKQGDVIPREVELQFCLEGSESLSVAQCPPTDHQDTPLSVAASCPVKATARVVHKSPLPDGRIAIGLTFRHLTSYDQLRLMRYAEEER